VDHNGAGAGISKYGERYHHGDIISTAVESTINQVVNNRIVKNNRCNGRRRGLTYFFRLETRVLNGDPHAVFRDWDPRFQQAAA